MLVKIMMVRKQNYNNTEMIILFSEMVNTEMMICRVLDRFAFGFIFLRLRSDFDWLWFKVRDQNQNTNKDTRHLFTRCSLIYSPWRETVSLNCLTIGFDQVRQVQQWWTLCTIEIMNERVSKLITSSVKPESHAGMIQPDRLPLSLPWRLF